MICATRPHKVISVHVDLVVWMIAVVMRVDDDGYVCGPDGPFCFECEYHTVTGAHVCRQINDPYVYCHGNSVRIMQIVIVFISLH